MWVGMVRPNTAADIRLGGHNVWAALAAAALAVAALTAATLAALSIVAALDGDATVAWVDGLANDEMLRGGCVKGWPLQQQAINSVAMTVSDMPTAGSSGSHEVEWSAPRTRGAKSLAENKRDERR